MVFTRAVTVGLARCSSSRWRACSPSQRERVGRGGKRGQPTPIIAVHPFESALLSQRLDCGSRWQRWWPSLVCRPGGAGARDVPTGGLDCAHSTVSSIGARRDIGLWRIRHRRSPAGSTDAQRHRERRADTRRVAPVVPRRKQPSDSAERCCRNGTRTGSPAQLRADACFLWLGHSGHAIPSATKRCSTEPDTENRRSPRALPTRSAEETS
jgi:hypothetical protein